MTRFSRAILLLALVAVPAQPSAGQSAINQRSTSARATINGSPRSRDGSFQATGVSGVCGEIPKEASIPA